MKIIGITKDLADRQVFMVEMDECEMKELYGVSFDYLGLDGILDLVGNEYEASPVLANLQENIAAIEQAQDSLRIMKQHLKGETEDGDEA